MKTEFFFNSGSKILTERTEESSSLLGVREKAIFNYGSYKTVRKKNRQTIQEKCPICNKSFQEDEDVWLSMWEGRTNLLVCEQCNTLLWRLQSKKE